MLNCVLFPTIFCHLLAVTKQLALVSSHYHATVVSISPKYCSDGEDFEDHLMGVAVTDQEEQLLTEIGTCNGRTLFVTRYGLQLQVIEDGRQFLQLY